MRLLYYLKTLRVMQYYLDFMGYLRSYIHFYIQLALFFHTLKTSFLKNALKSGQQCQAYVSKTRLKVFFKKR